jgi:hypothetical protein
MAMVNRIPIPVSSASPKGTSASSIDGDPINGHTMSLDGNCILHIYNNDQVDHTITIHIPILVEGQAVSDLIEIIKPFENQWFGGWDSQNDFPSGFLEFDVDSNLLKINAIRF